MRGKELLLQVKKHILEEPKRLNMEFGIQKIEWGIDNLVNTRVTVKEWPQCGTVGCIAGWLIQLGDPVFYEERGAYWPDIEAEAAELLEVHSRAAKDLFHVNNWPEEFSDDYISAEDPAQKATITGLVIDKFIAENYSEVA